MSKLNCADCGKPRGDSPSFSYCRDDYNRRQRERYAAQRREQGFEVAAKTATGQVQSRRGYLIANDGKPGTCECCGEFELGGLQPIYLGDVRNEEDLMGGGELTALWCLKCRELTTKLSPSELQRAKAMMTYLKQVRWSYDQILPPPHDTVFMDDKERAALVEWWTKKN